MSQFALVGILKLLITGFEQITETIEMSQLLELKLLEKLSCLAELIRQLNNLPGIDTRFSSWRMFFCDIYS